MSRSGDVWNASRPRFETFGENIGSLTNDVFKYEALTVQQGIDVLERDLKYELQSCEEEDINSWRSALYRELIRNIDKYSDWLLHLPSR